MDIPIVGLQDFDGYKKISSGSHKGQNGKLLIIGGSNLFHSASIWSLMVASRVVDLVHYASTPENNELVGRLKQEFLDGIIVPREEIDTYIEEDNAILIGPGLVRLEKRIEFDKVERFSLQDIMSIKDEGELTYLMTNYLLGKHPHKQWIIDAGALQMLELSRIPKNAILTPHSREFEGLWDKMQTSEFRIFESQALPLAEKLQIFAEKFQCIILYKGVEDVAVSGITRERRRVVGGNPGMTKGGTGDVLAGLIAALSCTNDPFLSTLIGSYVNKRAGDRLYSEFGPFYNATNVSQEISKVLKELFYE